MDDNRWQSIGSGFTDINSFLATIDFSEFKIAIEQRKRIAKKLEKLQATQRTTAKMLGVHQTTITKDLDEKSSKPKKKTAPIKDSVTDVDENSSKPSPAITQSGADIAAAAIKTAEQEAKKQQRTAEIKEERARIAEAGKKLIL